MRKCLLVAFALVLVTPAVAQTVYISDVLTVPLRSGPSTRHKILHAGLTSGTRLEVLTEDEANGFTQVRLRDGTEGWLRTQYLTAEPIAKVQLAAAERQSESLRAQLQTAEERLAATTAGSADAEQRVAELVERNQALEAELAEIKRISANAIALSTANQQLEARNQALESEVSDLSRTIASLERDVRGRWLLFGGGLVLIGVALGVALRSRRKRGSWA